MMFSCLGRIGVLQSKQANKDKKLLILVHTWASGLAHAFMARSACHPYPQLFLNKDVCYVIDPHVYDSNLETQTQIPHLFKRVKTK